MPRPHDPYQALRFPQFRLYLLATQAMFLSGQMAVLALGWTLYDRTGEAMPLAYLGLARYLPIFLLSLPAGLLADHPRRKEFLSLTLAFQVLALLGLAWTVHVHAPRALWYLLVFLWSSAGAVRTPLAVAFYPSLLPKNSVANSVSWNSSNFQISAVVGPVLGGLLLASLGPERALFVAALGPAIYVGTLFFLHPLRKPEHHGAVESLKQRILGGWTYIKKDGAIRWALTLDLFAVLFGGCEAILPIFAKDILLVGPVGLGWLAAAGFAGALVTSLWLAHHPLKKGGQAMLLAVAGFGVCMLVFALSKSYALSFLALFISGGLDAISVVVRQTLVQVRTPEHLRGRVQAVNFLFIGSSNELGEVESGATAAVLGPVGSVLMGGLATLGVVAYVAYKAPVLRRLGRLDRTQRN